MTRTEFDKLARKGFDAVMLGLRREAVRQAGGTVADVAPVDLGDHAGHKLRAVGSPAAGYIAFVHDGTHVRSYPRVVSNPASAVPWLREQAERHMDDPTAATP